jgi:hypothetical protein
VTTLRCGLITRPSSVIESEAPHPPRAGPWYRHKHTPSTLDMLVAFRRTMLTEYQHTHPAQPTSAKLTDALLTWDLTAA